MQHYWRGDYVSNVDPTYYIDDDVVVRGTTDRDLMRICGNYQTVYAGAGNDMTTVTGCNNALVYGEAGNDFMGVNQFSRNASIIGGKGNDTLRTLATKTYMDGGDDADLFIPLNSTANTTMIGGAGNDTFWFIESATVTVSGGAGKDIYRFDPYYLYGPYSNAVVITDISSEDIIRYDYDASNGEELSITELNGNIILKDEDFGNFKITLKGGASKKSEIANVAYRSVNWSGTLGELFPEFFSDTDTTSGGGTDTSSGGGGGTNTQPGGNVGVGVTVSNSTVNKIVTGTSYADSIYNSGANATINTGAGNDTIYNRMSDLTPYTYVSINSGDGSDYIYNSLGSGATVLAGAGNDTVQDSSWSNFTDGGDGDDSIYAASAATVNGGNGSDNILVAGYDNSVNGGAGNDKITFEAGEYSNNARRSVKGGAGNDSISIGAGSGGNVIQYATGDGNDFIYGITANDTLQISDAEYSTTKSGSNLIFGVGTGSITVYNGANVAFTIKGTLKGTPNNTITNYTDNTIISGTSYADTIINHGNKASIYGEGGGDGDDWFVNNSNSHDIYLYGGNGNDTVGSGIYVDGGAGNDDLYGWEYGTVIGGAGKDTIVLSKKNITADGGDDNDEIYSIYFFKSDSTSASINGGKGNDSINMFGTYHTIKGGVGNDSIFANAGYSFVSGKEGNDFIEIWGDDSVSSYNSSNTISGGAGNDIISFDDNNRKNLIVYNSGDGSDIITGISSNHTLKITGAKYSTTKIGNDLIISVGSGKITVKGGANISFTIDGTLDGGEEDTIIFNNAKESLATAATITADYEEGEFDAADYGKLKTINASEVSTDLTIYGNKIADKIIAGDGNDCIFGGKGNDTFTGGGGADTFAYIYGDDNKVITDYTEGEDKIEIQGADVANVLDSASIKGNDVIFKIGTGKITVKGGADIEINIVDDSGNEESYSNARPLELFEDNNFIIDGTNLDSITEQKFSVTEIQSADYSTFAQDKNILVYSNEK